MAAAIKRLLSPTEWADRQIETLKSVGRKNYEVGIAGPKDDPIAAGIRAQPRYVEQMSKAEVLERRKTALEKTDMATWYKYSKEIGAENLVKGVEKRKDKVTKFLGTWQPILKGHLDKIDALAEVTDSDRENKMLENLRGLKALKGKA